MTDYRLIRSDRKTVSLRVLEDGSAEVRAPLFMPKRDIDRFVRSKEAWIAEARKRITSERENAGPGFLDWELKEMAERMRILLPPLLKDWSATLGVSYGRVTVRNQKTRWGSCSSEGNLNFNCLLAEAPPSVLRYVVVHELCHRKEMNHSSRFWALVGSTCPDYRESVRWLKTEGRTLMARARPR